jgi:hypothetical protein
MLSSIISHAKKGQIGESLRVRSQAKESGVI